MEMYSFCKNSMKPAVSTAQIKDPSQLHHCKAGQTLCVFIYLVRYLCLTHIAHFNENFCAARTYNFYVLTDSYVQTCMMRALTSH